MEQANKIRLPRFIITAPYVANFMTILDFLISQLKKVAVVKRLFWQLGTRFSGRCRCREVAVVESWPLWRGGRCREVAILDRWAL